MLGYSVCLSRRCAEFPCRFQPISRPPLALSTLVLQTLASSAVPTTLHTQMSPRVLLRQPTSLTTEVRVPLHVVLYCCLMFY